MGTHPHQRDVGECGCDGGFPPSQASSGSPADLHPAPGPRAGSDLLAPASCSLAPGVELDEDRRAT